MVEYTCKDCGIIMDEKTNLWADVFTIHSQHCDSCIEHDYMLYVTKKTELAITACPHGEPFHFHHDGCPSCYTDDYGLDEGNYVQ